MNTETTTKPATVEPATPPDSVFATPSAKEAWKLFHREIATYRRELPRLLQEGKGGWHVLIKDDDILGIWNTWEEAIQAGRDRFGLAPIYVAKIDPRDPERFALLDARIAAECQG